FQAEDGIRDRTVTGVQTCALPISEEARMTRPPFHADQVGSLLRPPELREARSAKVSPEELKEVEDRCIARAVKRQEEIGLQSIKIGRASCRERGELSVGDV